MQQTLNNSRDATNLYLTPALHLHARLATTQCPPLTLTLTSPPPSPSLPWWCARSTSPTRTSPYAPRYPYPYAKPHLSAQVVCTIHQPNSDITDMFDDFMLLSDGSMVYGGTWRGAVPFFTAQGYVYVCWAGGRGHGCACVRQLGWGGGAFICMCVCLCIRYFLHQGGKPWGSPKRCGIPDIVVQASPVFWDSFLEKFRENKFASLGLFSVLPVEYIRKVLHIVHSACVHVCVHVCDTSMIVLLLTVHPTLLLPPFRCLRSHPAVAAAAATPGAPCTRTRVTTSCPSYATLTSAAA